jgi:hypothetical protein
MQNLNTPNGTMVHVYKLPESLYAGYCFNGGQPVEFLNVDWFNGYKNMKREDLEAYIRGKPYAQTGGDFLVLSPDNDLAFSFKIDVDN